MLPALRVPARRALSSSPLSSAYSALALHTSGIRHSSTSSTSSSQESTLLVEDLPTSIRLITLNRPKQLNALTPADLDAFIEAVEGAPDSVRAIAVTGAGRAFCAGMNTDAFHGLSTSSARELITKVGRAVGTLRLSPKPTAVLLNGYCLGAAFEMALAADFRVAYPSIRVGLPETKVGIPSVVDAALLRHHVGLSRAKEMLLAGEIWPVSAMGEGFVNAWASPATPGKDGKPTGEGDIVERGVEFLGKVTGLTPVVMAAQKKLNEAWLNVSHVDGIEKSIDVFARVFEDPATHEAVKSYNEGRKK